jgi:hypothetical protein
MIKKCIKVCFDTLFKKIKLKKGNGFMKKFGEEGKGITTYVNENSLIIDVPFDILKIAFEYSPDNYDESTLYAKMEKVFAELIAKHLHDETDSETGSNFIHNMLDSVFTEIFEGNIEADGIIAFGSDEDE